jgi:hypothetical protein
MMLHTIGDCHGDIPWYSMKPSDIPLFEGIRNNGIGYTLTLVGAGKLERIDISKSYYRSNPIPTMDLEHRKIVNQVEVPYQQDFNIKDGDAIVFCFGEIDCRLIFANPDYSEIWKDMVDVAIPTYFDTIKLNVEQFNHLHTMVLSVIPPTNNEILGLAPKEGDGEDRKKVTLYVNNKIKEYCEKYNYIFFDIYDKYCDENGFLSRKLSDDSFHIANPIYYIEFLNNLKYQ